MADKAGFITRYRQELGRILVALDGELGMLDDQYDALDYSNALTDDDFTGANSDLTANQFKDGVASLRAVRLALHTGGHNTNLYRLRREDW